MNPLAGQLRQIVRRLWRASLFTVITLVTLAAGVGANIAIFSVVEGVLLKPLPYPHPESLVAIWHTAPGLNFENVNMGPSNYFIYREQNRVFEDVGIYQGNSVSVTGQGNPEQVQALDVTDGVLPILGIKPLLGRWFTGENAIHAYDRVVKEYQNDLETKINVAKDRFHLFLQGTKTHMKGVFRDGERRQPADSKTTQ